MVEEMIVEQSVDLSSTCDLGSFFELRSESILAEVLPRIDIIKHDPDSVDALRSKERARNELRQHLTVFHNALYVGFPALFGQHMAWLRSVVDARGQDPASILKMLDTIREQLLILENHRNRALAERTLAEGEQAFGRPDRSAAAADDDCEPHATYHTFTRSLIDGDRHTATRIVTDALRGGANMTGVGVGLVQPAMYEIGELWQRNKVTVAQEHLATTICHNVLAMAYARTSFKEPRGLCAIFAALEGNHHVLGLRMTSDAFEAEGWTVNHLGADTPLVDLMRMIDSTKPNLIGLSISLNSHIEQLGEAVTRLRAEFAGRCPTVAIGGLPLLVNPDLVSAINADVWFPDAEAARRDAQWNP